MRLNEAWRSDFGMSWTLLRLEGLFQRAAYLLFLLLLSAGLFQFSMLVRAGEVLHDAARTGIRESLLPAATVESVTSATRRRLAGGPRGAFSAAILVRINGRPALPDRSIASGDRVAVTVRLPVELAAVDWLGYVGIRPAGRTLRARTVITRP
ncbi:MAG: hypothetical protein ACC645_12340 [Pirellulales bacterium]